MSPRSLHIAEDGGMFFSVFNVSFSFEPLARIYILPVTGSTSCEQYLSGSISFPT